MALSDLSKVTQTLMTLLEQNVSRLSRTVVTVTPQSPDKVEASLSQLSLYLYHIGEDGYYKNAPGPGSNVPNITSAPMALRLFYILTAHHDFQDGRQDALTEQRLMGYALKTLHDFPVITDKTQVPGNPRPVIDPSDLELPGRGNKLQIELRPITPEDALAFWHSEENRTARLSAYYEVRVVMLEPEAPKTMPGIVLSLGAFVLQAGAPHLERSQSTVRFRLPARNGGSVQPIEATPAQITLDAPGNELLLLGANLGGGKARQLVLRNSLWARLPAPDGPVEQAAVDLAQNPNWQVEFRTDRILVRPATTLRHVTPNGTTVDLPMLPGFYNAFIRVVQDEKIVNNEVKQISVASNEVSFAVAPRIVGHDAPDANGNIRIDLGDEFDPTDPSLPEDAIQVVVAGRVYARCDDDPLVDEAEFSLTNTPANLIRIRPHFPVTVTEATAHPFRLIVYGAESAPFWIDLKPIGA